LRHVEIDPVDRAEARESSGGNGLEIALRRQIGKRPIDERRRVLLFDRANDRNQQLIACNPTLGGLDEITPFDAGEGFERPVGRLAVGVIRERIRLPVAAGERRRIVGVVTQPRVHVLAHAFERLLVEPGGVDRKPQEFGSAIEVLGERAHAPAPMIAVAVERHFDRDLVQGAVKRLRIEITRPLVEKSRHQRAEARLFRTVLRRAAAHGEFERNERHRVRWDEPKFQSARARHDVDIDGGMRGRNGEVLLHERFRNRFCGFVLGSEGAKGRGR